MTPAASDAARILGTQIRLARHNRRWTAAEFAERAGVSERTVLAVEKGSPSASFGNVMNLAALAGVELFSVSDPAELAIHRRRGEEKLALIPGKVYHSRAEGDSGDYDF